MTNKERFMEICSKISKGVDGVVIADRAKLLQSHDDGRLFSVMLNTDYGAKYADSAHLTVYFDIKDGQIISGLYDLSSCEKQKPKRLVRVFDDGIGMTRRYVYSQQIITEMQKKIADA